MSDNRENSVLPEKTLREYAKREVPSVDDPWPAIRQRVQAVSAHRQSRPEPETAIAPEPGRRWPPRLVPGTPLGYALAVLSVLILAVGVYAASGPIREFSRQGLPSGVGSGERPGSESRPAPDEHERGPQGFPDEWAEDLVRQTAPEIAEADLDVRLNETRTVDGITVALERAYADEGSVVVVTSASGWNNQATRDPASVHSPLELGDGSDTTFEPIDNSGVFTDPADQSIKVGGEAWIQFFDPSGNLEPHGRHDFQLSVRFGPRPVQNANGSAEELRSLTFDFSVPVRELDVIDVGQTVEANGISMTLDRVEYSPARTQAIFCFDPPQDEKYNWMPVTKRPIINDFFLNDTLYRKEPEEPTGCIGYDLYRSLYDKPGNHSITVTEIEGRTRTYANPERTIRGPWAFEFEVPQR